MITEAKFYNGAVYITAPASPTALARNARVVTVEASTSSLTLPNATLLSNGGPHFYIFCEVGSHTGIALTDFSSNVLATILVGQIAVVTLLDNSTANGIWRVGIWNA